MPLPLFAAATTVSVGRRAAASLGSAAGAIGDMLGVGKQATESGCQVVAEADRAAFISGRVAPWIVGQRQADLGEVLGVPSDAAGNPPTAEQLGYTFARVAQMHMDEFTPLCEELSGGARYKSSEDPAAIADRTRAREAWKARKRQELLGGNPNLPVPGAPTGYGVPGAPTFPRPGGVTGGIGAGGASGGLKVPSWLGLAVGGVVLAAALYWMVSE